MKRIVDGYDQPGVHMIVALPFIILVVYIVFKIFGVL